MSIQVTTPTSKETLLEALGEIDLYYRYRRDEYEGLELTPLSLTSLVAPAKTAVELEAEAAVAI